MGLTLSRCQGLKQQITKKKKITPVIKKHIGKVFNSFTMERHSSDIFLPITLERLKVNDFWTIHFKKVKMVFYITCILPQ